MMDTLSYADYLERNGFSQQQAKALAHATQEHLLAQIVTRDHLRAELLAHLFKISGIMIAVGAFYTSVPFFLLKN
jgi:hypothetical protein